MSAPTQFKGRLNELLSQVRLQSQASAMSGGGEKYNMDPFLISDIRALLKQQQDGLQVNNLAFYFLTYLFSSNFGYLN
jgi:nuclear pore complex protein Nup54